MKKPTVSFDQTETSSFDQTETSYLTTRELAELLRVEAATIRRGLCVNGHYMGVKPLKLTNGRLLWPKSDALKVIQPETADEWD
jgi:hypothetical protein